MSESIQLTSEKGTLRISRALPELTSVLSFRHTFEKPGDTVTFRDRKTGKEKTIVKRGKITSQIEPLYIIGSDNCLYTHDGCLSMVTDTLVKLGFQYEYERLNPQWPTYIINRDVVKGLYPNQREGIVRLLLSTGGGMLEAATSMGKTRVIAALVRAYPNEKIVIMTHRQSVVRGLVANLNDLLKEDKIDVGICQGPNQRHTRVTVSTIGSAHHLEAGECRIFIADEVHRFASESAANTVLSFTRAVKYGVSATISGKFAGTTKFLESLFGPIVFKVTDQELESDGKVPPIDAYFLSNPEGPNVDSLNGPTQKKRGVWENPQRNRLIKQVIDLAPADQQLLVFVETKKHLDQIVRLCPELETCHADLGAKARKSIEERFTSGQAKRVISTDCLSEGVDPRALMIMIDASAVRGDSSLVQKRGRLRRPGKAKGILINFMDEFSEVFSARAEKRIKDHKSRGDTVIEMATPEQIKFLGSSIDPE